MPNLRERYREEVLPAMMREFEYDNVMEVPKVQKVVVNVGVGEALDNAKSLDATVGDLTTITGQKPIITKARKSIAGFKLREGRAIGVKVTLRGDRMWNFLDRLMNIALPRRRDFRGVPAEAFDGRGNYTLGLREQIIFPEIEYDKIAATVAGHAVQPWWGRTLVRSKENDVAKTSSVEREKKRKFAVRVRNRCRRCGRPRGYFRRFQLCRICFRELALAGQIPGVAKSSW
jgi:large subunit ribosomal protein L5